MDRVWRGALIILFVSTFLSFIAGFLLSFLFTSLPSINKLSRLTSDNSELRPDVTEKLIDRIDRKSLKTYLTWLAREPHPVGSRRDTFIQDWIRRTFLKFESFNHVGLDVSNVILSLPPSNEEGNSNRVELIDGDNRVFEVLKCDVSTACYAAFSKKMDLDEMVEGDVVYVNFGSKEDLEQLRISEAITLTGKIALARIDLTNRLLPGQVALNAQLSGAKALIMFRDEDQHREYNDQTFNENSVMRLSLNRLRGDISTPGFPSFDDLMSRLSEEQQMRLESLRNDEKTDFPDFTIASIPVQPVSTKDGLRLLAALGGRRAPINWQGSNGLMVRNIGGTFISNSGINKVRLIVNNQLRRGEIANVLGVIRGEVEPDRYVIIGAPRDAFVYGALYPSSGIAALMKVAEALDFTIKNSDWRPRRSIVFASWAASTLGNVGSTEFVEKNEQKLRNRAVAYINADLCSGGPQLASSASGSLKAALIAALKAIPFNSDSNRNYEEEDAEMDEEKSYYHYFQSSSTEYYRNLAKIPDLNVDGDQASFASRIGINSLSVRFNSNSSSDFRAKNSESDTLQHYEQFSDPDYRLLQLCTRVLAHLARNVSDQLWLPFEPEQTVTKLQMGIRDLKESVQPLLQQQNQIASEMQGVDFGALERAVQGYSVVSANFSQFLQNNKESLKEDGMSVRMMNDVIMETERIFVLPIVPMRNGSYHVILYDNEVFPGAQRLLEEMRENRSNEDLALLWAALRTHIDHIVIALLQATSHLKDFHVLT